MAHNQVSLGLGFDLLNLCVVCFTTHYVFCMRKASLNKVIL